MRPKRSALVALTITAACAGGPSTAGAAPRTDSVERGVVRKLNTIRAQHGMGVLRLDGRLARAADAHSRDMARRSFFAHESSDGTPMAQRVGRYTSAAETAETLALVSTRQRRKAGAVVRMWMRSPGHRAALLTPEFRRIGVAKRAGHVAGQSSAVFTADLSTSH